MQKVLQLQYFLRTMSDNMNGRMHKHNMQRESAKIVRVEDWPVGKRCMMKSLLLLRVVLLVHRAALGQAINIVNLLFTVAATMEGCCIKTTRCLLVDLICKYILCEFDWVTFLRFCVLSTAVLMKVMPTLHVADTKPRLAY